MSGRVRFVVVEEEEEGGWNSSCARESAREAREVKGMLWFLRACCVEVRRSHSRAMAWAR
jgi:hypothetical protein